jgi:signal transduction histidine kinase
MFESGGSAVWALVAVAVGTGALLGAAGWLLGRSVERQRHTQQLHHARQTARLRTELQGGVAWRTDRHHAVSDWRTPEGGVALRGQPLAGLFAAAGDAGAALAAALAAERAFGPLLLKADDAAQLGGVTWRVRALPSYDGAGLFDGHVGVAECVDHAGDSGPMRIDALDSTRAGPETPPSNEQALADSFSLTVAHDLRAPIRVVEGFARIVKEDYGRQLDRVANDHLDRVLGAAARMNLMIDALLTLARLSTQPLSRQPVNLSQLAGYVVDDLKRASPDREGDFEIEPGLSVRGDPTLLRLVLENLLGNAWKYTARTPRPRITLRSLRPVDAPRPSPAQRMFEVRDNGAGFDMRHAERLFGLFQRLHSAGDFPGHGVGLASVKRIVERHGGEIWAESEPGRGAAFVFTLAG